MKKLLVVLLLLVGAMSAVAGGMTADQLIGNYIAAMGGEKSISTLKSLYMKGTYTMKGMPMQMTMYLKPPDKGFMEFSMNNMVMGGGGTNGTDAWQTQMGQTFYLEGEHKLGMMRQVDIFPLVDYQKKGGKAKYIGEVPLGESQVHKMEYITPEADTMHFYFDTKSFYVVRLEGKNAATVMSDYRKIGPLVMPYKFVTTGQAGEVTTVYDSMAVNSEIPDSLFVMPKNAKPMPKMPGMGGMGK
jgi:zinc protease